MGFIGFVFRIIARIFLRLLLPALFLGIGWYAGAKYGAPDLLIRAVDGVIARGQTALAPILGRGAEVAGDLATEGVERGGELAAEAAQQGGEYVVGTVEQALEELAEGPDETEDQAPEDAAEPGQEPALASRSDSAPTATNTRDITLCPGMDVSNAPRADSNGVVRRAGATITFKGVNLLLMPATQSCLSSGYGNRNGRLHKGVDYHPRSGKGDVLAAGDGVIIQATTRDDYGKMIVIDHGNDVYTLYAHLAGFGSGMREGASVRQGQVIAPIGNTGYSNIIHLHWEILSGEWNDAAGPFGLDPINPFAL